MNVLKSFVDLHQTNPLAPPHRETQERGINAIDHLRPPVYCQIDTSVTDVPLLALDTLKLVYIFLQYSTWHFIMYLCILSNQLKAKSNKQDIVQNNCLDITKGGLKLYIYLWDTKNIKKI